MEVRVLRVSVPAAHGAEHHVAARDFAFVHLSQMHSLVMNAQGPFVAVHFVADIAKDACITAPGGGMHELSETLSACSLSDHVSSLALELSSPLPVFPLTVHLLLLLFVQVIQQDALVAALVLVMGGVDAAAGVKAGGGA